jgi:hypothetical protein
LVKATRRQMLVDADDIDGIYNAPPTGATLTNVITQMQVRGRAALEAQNKVVSQDQIWPTYPSINIEKILKLEI